MAKTILYPETFDERNQFVSGLMKTTYLENNGQYSNSSAIKFWAQFSLNNVLLNCYAI